MKYVHTADANTVCTLIGKHFGLTLLSLCTLTSVKFKHTADVNTVCTLDGAHFCLTQLFLYTLNEV